MATITYQHVKHSNVHAITDTFTTDNQGSPSIAVLSNGDVVTTYNHFGKTQLAMTAHTGAVAPNVTPPEFEVAPVNSTFAGDQFGSQTAALTKGGFVTVFNDTSSGDNQLRYRVFDNKGTALNNDALVFEGFETTTMGGVAGLKNGDFVIAFETNDSTNDHNADFAVFGADGTMKGGFAVDDLLTTDAILPSVAARGDGFVYAWSYVAANGNTSVHVQNYSAGGGMIGNKITVDNVGSINDQAQVIGLKDGGFAVAYRDNGWGVSATEITLRIYNADGTARTSWIQANEATDGIQDKPSLTLLDNGFIALTWQTAASASPTNTDVASRIFDTNGVAITSQFVVADGAFAQKGGDAVGLSAGILTHVFETADPSLDGSGSGIGVSSTRVTRQIVGDGTAETLTGDELIDKIFGGGGADKIFGGAGVDTIEGGAGGDKLDGGADVNVLSYESSIVGVDVDLLGNTAKNGDAQGDTLVAGTFRHIHGSLTGDDTLSGNDKINFLYGNGGNDTLSGGGGFDRLFGNDGKDTLIAWTSDEGSFDGGNGVDWIIYEGETTGITLKLDGSGNGGGAKDDKVSTIENAFGSHHDDLIYGTDGIANELNGSEGLDKLYGLGGADTLKGGFGDDTLDGGEGADMLIGGQDNDTLIVDTAGDIVVEVAGGGAADRVMARASYTLAADADIEKLTTTSSAGTSAINLTGNKLSQEIFGNAGENTLKDGGGAADSLRGLGGNDTYLVYSVGTTIVESAAQGALDKVLSNVDFVLGAGVHIEQLATTSGAGVSGIDLTGNETAQTIKGNAGSNILDGKEGLDTLSGLSGMDFFVFSTALGAANVDTITDFSVAADTIQLDDAIFAVLATGVLTAGAFLANTTGIAADASDRIVYETDTGKLFYDADGNGADATGIQFATLTDGLALTNADFVVI